MISGFYTYFEMVKDKYQLKCITMSAIYRKPTLKIYVLGKDVPVISLECDSLDELYLEAYNELVTWVKQQENITKVI